MLPRTVAFLLLLFSSVPAFAQTAGPPYSGRWQGGVYEGVHEWLSVHLGLGAAWTEGPLEILSDPSLLGFAWQFGMVAHLDHEWAASVDLCRMSAEADSGSHGTSWGGYSVSNTTLSAAAIWTPLVWKFFELGLAARLGFTYQSSSATAQPYGVDVPVYSGHSWSGSLLYGGGDLLLLAFPVNFLEAGLRLQGGVLAGFDPVWNGSPLDYGTPSPAAKPMVTVVAEAGCHF